MDSMNPMQTAPVEPYCVIPCGAVTVSLDGIHKPMRSEGSLQFFEHEMSVCSLGEHGMFKSIAGCFTQREQIRFPYTAIANVRFKSKRCAILTLKDGRFAFFKYNGKDFEKLRGLFSAYNIIQLLD